MNTDRIEECTKFYNGIILKLLLLRNLIDKHVASGTDNEPFEHVDIYNVQMHLLLFQMDLAIASKHFIIRSELKETDEVNYFARAISVHLSDILNSKNGARNKLSFILKKYFENQTYTNLVKELTSLTKILKRISNEHLNEINQIRTTLFAHKLGNGIDQSLEMKKIDVMKLLFIGADVHDTLLEIGRLLCNFFVDFQTVKPNEKATSTHLNIWFATIEKD